MKIYTEEDPPYSFTAENGSPSGFGVDVVKEIQRRVKNGSVIQIVPWARAYKMIRERENVAVFTMSRTPEREKLFYWVGPIVQNDWVFIGKKNSGVKIRNIEDAKKLEAVGTVRSYAWTTYLQSKGFTNLDIVNERKQNPLKLNAGRIQAFVSADSSYKKAIEMNGLDVNDFVVLYRFKTIEMYIAFSKNTDVKVVSKWSEALQNMKHDGSFRSIHKKWLPNNVIPK